jgi:hypothetical protein
MTDAEKQSFKHNALLGLVARLNGVDAGNGVTLTTTDASGTTLVDPSSGRLRRANVVNFVASFPKTTVTTSEATAAAATVTPTNPLVISYAKADSSTGGATATSASVSAGTAAPTPSTINPGLEGAGLGGGSSSDDSATTVIWVTILCVVIVVCVVAAIL